MTSVALPGGDVAPRGDSTLVNVVSLVAGEPALQQIAGRKLAVLGVPEAARAAAIAALPRTSGRRLILAVTPTVTDAEELHHDLGCLLGRDAAALFPAWETLPFERVSPAIETMGRRLEVLWRMGDEARRPVVVVAPIRSVLQVLSPRSAVTEPISVTKGVPVDLERVGERLVEFGYRHETTVEHRGEFSRRGAILDVFPSTADVPVRIDTWGDEIERMTTFDVNDQRSETEIDRLLVFPARELITDAAMRERARALVADEPWGREQWERLAEGQSFDGMESWLPWLVGADSSTIIDHLDPEIALLALVEPSRIGERARDVVAEEDDLARALASSWTRDADVEFPRLHRSPDTLLGGALSLPAVNIVPPAEALDSPTIEATGWAPIVHDPSPLTRRISELIAAKWHVVVAAESPDSAPRISTLLREHGLDVSLAGAARLSTAPGAAVVVTPIHRGFALSASKVAVVTEADLTGRRRARRPRPFGRRGSATVFEDLRPGGFVVHQHHGVGVYEGMVPREIAGVERDYLLIAYKGGDKLYVPTDQIGSLRQYVGGEAPTLHRLGGSDFAKAKSRVRSAVREVAQELVVLYQRRAMSAGHRFAPDTPWQHEMESAFPFVETPDQAAAIDAVKADMEREIPMDRLLCGDVGFGKTEVAVRAAFKAIQDGMQVAVLVPTTLLATQHGNTFAERFAGYPVRIEVLSRFVTASRAKAIVEGLRTGEIDCVIGTHRLLQESVTFKNLGLLVVDEEQRFGVQHKEAMKRLRTNVDTLTMSATPIPRTLEMSLVGIRDLSLLQTPPADRQPILTYVGEQSEHVAIEAIRRELLRDGQVFWVHNRVQSIEERAQHLRELVPEARIAVAHGQMEESRLEQVVLDFWEGRHDVLVCTTIIESGIDMPAVNTLVVERADLLGLGQLHQLRGRVGRGGQRAYAYLFYPRDVRLTEQAHERLRTIGESTDLGSGFKIAMRDLEIRGAGNLLGEAQSGHIAAVGYDLYCQMVSEAVSEMKGELPVEKTDVVVDLPVDAHLPVDYVPSEELRLEAYRRLADVVSLEAVEDLEREWRDRYGPLPAAAAALVTIGTLRAEAARLGISEIVLTNREIRISPIELRASQQMGLRHRAPRAAYREQHKQLVLPDPRPGVDDIAAHVLDLLRGLFAGDDD